MRRFSSFEIKARRSGDTFSLPPSSADFFSFLFPDRDIIAPYGLVETTQDDSRGRVAGCDLPFLFCCRQIQKEEEQTCKIPSLVLYSHSHTTLRRLTYFSHNAVLTSCVCDDTASAACLDLDESGRDHSRMGILGNERLVADHSCSCFPLQN